MFIALTPNPKLFHSLSTAFGISSLAKAAARESPQPGKTAAQSRPDGVVESFKKKTGSGKPGGGKPSVGKSGGKPGSKPAAKAGAGKPKGGKPSARPDKHKFDPGKPKRKSS